MCWFFDYGLFILEMLNDYMFSLLIFNWVVKNERICIYYIDNWYFLNCFIKEILYCWFDNYMYENVWINVKKVWISVGVNYVGKWVIWIIEMIVFIKMMFGIIGMIFIFIEMIFNFILKMFFYYKYIKYIN